MSKKKVLVVDDEKIICELLKQGLVEVNIMIHLLKTQNISSTSRNGIFNLVFSDIPADINWNHGFYYCFGRLAVCVAVSKNIPTCDIEMQRA